MSHPYEKLRAIAGKAIYVVAYRPRQTRKGHWVWSRSHEVATYMNTSEFRKSEHSGVSYGGVNNMSLRPEEMIHCMASDAPVMKHDVSHVVDLLCAVLKKAFADSIAELKAAKATHIILHKPSAKHCVAVSLDKERFCISVSREQQ